MPAPAVAKPRDPRARRQDPRKRETLSSQNQNLPPDAKRQKQEVNDAIAELASGMTPERLSILPPNEREMLRSYMEENGIPFECPP